MSVERRRIAIVGSGPSGFYLAEALERAGQSLQIDLIDRLPTPFGLVRGGVAPDHPKIKSIAAVFDRIAQRPGIRFIGNIEIGRDLSLSELRERYDAVVLAYGAEQDAALGLPGEKISGSHGAGEFVGWYNGHPSYCNLDFDLSADTAVVIGLGNVAADICRMLLTPVEELAKTDIADHALEKLSRSAIRTVHLVGRRGPADAKFSPPELRELGAITGCVPVISDADIAKSSTQSPLDEAQAKTLGLFKSIHEAKDRHGDKKLHFHFWKIPGEIIGNEKVQSIRLTNSAGSTEEIGCGLIFRCIGFGGIALPGMSIDPRKGTIANDNGRVIEEDKVQPGLYVSGWLKRGPSGTIGSNRADSFTVAGEILKDLPALATPKNGEDIVEYLRAKGARPVSYADWQKIDVKEIAGGKTQGRPRRKFVRTEELLEAAK